MTEAPLLVSSKTYDEMNIGDTASLTRTLTKRDVQLFAIVTGDMNPAHLDEAYAKTDMFHQIIAHGMWTGSMFSVLLGMQLPGPGTIYLDQSLKFLKPVHLGDTVTASVTVTKKDDKHKFITFATLCVNQKNEHIVEGEAMVIASAKKISVKAVKLPEVQIKTPEHNHEQWLLNKVAPLKPLKVAVVHPVDALSLKGAVAAAEAGIIEAILIGPETKIRAAAKEADIDLKPYTIIATEHSQAAVAVAVEMARSGKVGAIMKGKLHTEELMEGIVDKQAGLRTGRRMSHVLVLDVPSYPKPLFLTDAAINIAPTLADKKDIVQNAIDLFMAMGLGTPKVALLSAVETIDESMPSTLDASALCKMAERGQITGGILDGPLAFDNAISHEAAAIKSIVSPVAGDADILVVPDLESGNMLYKELCYFSGVQGAGIVLGAKVPIILTSRADDIVTRVTSCALAALYVEAKNA